jgi:hypothetical protein
MAKGTGLGLSITKQVVALLKVSYYHCSHSANIYLACFQNYMFSESYGVSMHIIVAVHEPMLLLVHAKHEGVVASFDVNFGTLTLMLVLVFLLITRFTHFCSCVMLHTVSSIRGC